MSAPQFKIEDLKAAFEEIFNEPRRGSTITIHHPRCPAVEAKRSGVCTCGGSAFPATEKEET